MKSNKSKYIGVSILQTLNQSTLTLNQRRLLKDLKEMKNNKIEMVGVSAEPLEENINIWHANILGPKNTIYQDGVFHLEINFPLDYPLSPPTITLLTPVKHPNIFGSQICLDLLNKIYSKDEPFSGWFSGYSVMSILMQLQNFLYEGHLKQNYSYTEEKNIKILIKDNINSFNCKNCRHSGKLSPFPKISLIKQKEDDLNIKSENYLFSQNLNCFHSKKTYKENPLGFGIKVFKKIKTGVINKCEIAHVYISLKTFIKEKVRKSFGNESFKYWIPYFGHNLDQEENLIIKSCSFILKNTTKNAHVLDVCELLPHLMFSIALNITEEKIHPSITYLRIFINLYIQMIYFIEKYPEVKNFIEHKVKHFTDSEENQNKKSCPNISILNIYSILNTKFDYDFLKPFYLKENFARQIFWIEKKVPQIIEKEEIDDNIMNTVFECSRVSYNLNLFFQSVFSLTKKHYKSLKNLLKSQTLGKLLNSFEDDLQNEIFKLRNYSSYVDYFKHLNMKKTNDEIKKVIKESIQLSEKRNYHGNLEKLIDLKTPEEQYNNYLLTHKKDFLKILENKEEKNYDLLLKDNFDFYEILHYEMNYSIEEIAYIIDDFKYENCLEYSVNKQTYKILENQYLKKYKFDIYSKLINTYENLTKKELFLKLMLEREIKFFYIKSDFKRFYKIIEYLKNEEFKCLNLFQIPVDRIKNKYYYINILLSNLTIKNINLKSLISTFDIRYFKQINKSIKNNLFESINIYNYNIDTETTELSKLIENIFEKLKNLKSIKFKKFVNWKGFNNISLLKNLVRNSKNLKEIYIDSNNRNDKLIEGLIDGLIKAKNLEVLILNYNKISNRNLDKILYNLSFLPSLKYLDLSNTTILSKSDFYLNLGKVLNISTKIKYISLKNINSYENIEEFFKEIKTNNSLEILDLSQKTHKSNLIPNLEQLSYNVAINNKLTNNVKELYLNNIFTEDSFNKFVEGFKISKYDLVLTLEGKDKANELLGKSLKKKFFSNLKVLSMTGLKIKNLKKNIFKDIKNNKKNIPSLTNLIRNSKELEYLNLKNSEYGEHFINYLFASFYDDLYEDNNNSLLKSKDVELKDNNSKNINIDSLNSIKLKTLILDDNKLTKIEFLPMLINKLSNLEILSLKNCNAGFKLSLIAKTVGTHKNLKYLNLYENKISIEGIKNLSDEIFKNKNLEFLDFGFNNIKSEGANYIIEKMVKYESKIKYLSFVFNKLNDSIIKLILEKEDKLSLKNVFLKYNDFNNYQINKIYEENFLDSKIFLDIYDNIYFIKKERLQRTALVQLSDVISLKYILYKEKKDLEYIVTKFVMKENTNKKSKNNNQDKLVFIEFLSKEVIDYLMIKENFKVNKLDLINNN